MTKMTDDELLRAIRARLDESDNALSEEVRESRAKAMRYYRGENPDPLPVVAGRSKMVVTEVRDTILWVLPDLTKIFTGGDKVVSIEPVGEEDEGKAEVAEAWVNYVIMRMNPGYMNTQTWIHDALLNKVGFLKQYWKNNEQRTREAYEGLIPEELELLKEQDDYEIVDTASEDMYLVRLPDGSTELVDVESADELPPGVELVLNDKGEPVTIPVYDVEGYRVKNEPIIVEEVIPPEEIIVGSDTRSVPHDCSFIAHEREITLSELRELLPDVDIPDDLQGPQLTGTMYSSERQERDKLEHPASTPEDENTAPDPSMRTVWLYEVYMKADRDGDGKAEWTQTFLVGDTILATDEVDYPHIFALCPVPWPHRFFGMSLADLVMDLQDLQTAINRQLLDALYLANNPRTELDVNGLTEYTIDDLLDNRIGGYVRVKRSGTVQPLVQGQIQPWSFDLLELWEQKREQRTGISRYATGLDPNALNKTATGVMNLMSQAAKRIEQIARIFAETGFKDRVQGILDLSQRYPKMVGKRVFRLTNQLVDISADALNGKFDLIVNAGIGAGNKEMRAAAMESILNHQFQLIQLGFGPGSQFELVKPENLHAALKEILKAYGWQASGDYVSEPKADQPPPQPQPDPQAMLAEAQIELMRQDMALKREKQQQEYELKKRELEIKAEEAATNRMEAEIKAAEVGMKQVSGG